MKTLKSCVRHLAQMQKHYAKPADTDMNSTVYSDLKRDVDSCGKEVEDPPNKKYMLCLKKVSFELLFCFQYRARNHRNHQILDTPSFWMVPLCNFIKKIRSFLPKKQSPQPMSSADVHNSMFASMEKQCETEMVQMTQMGSQEVPQNLEKT